MKKIILLIAVLAVAFSGRAQVSNLDTTTVHAVGGGAYITGDPLNVAAGKLNTSINWLWNYCNTNAATNTLLGYNLLMLQTNLATTSNLWNTAISDYGNFLTFTNWFYPAYYFTQTNLSDLNSAAAPAIFWTPLNTASISTISNLLVNGSSWNIVANSFQGQLIDAYSSSGMAGYMPVADGYGGWYWTAITIPSFPDITDTGGNVGISQPSPAYPLDVGGNMEIGFTAGGNGNYIQGDDGSGNIVLNPAYGGVVKVNNELDVDAGANILQLSVDGFSMDYALFFLPGSALTAGDNADFGTDGSVSVAYGACQIDPGGNLKITTLNSDGGNFTSDGAGNVTAQTFTPLSDRTLKENIVALPPSVALAMASSLTNYEWNFKARTNLVSRLTRQRIESFTTNAVTGKVRANWVFNMTTNTAAKVIPASSRQFGPMAQDWHAATGLDDGHHISVTAMQGLLLGSIQALNLKQAAITAQDTNAGTLYLKLPEVTIAHSTNSTYGQGAGLVAFGASGGTNYAYFSLGTNSWGRVPITQTNW